ncbi:4'-phosphopantetheinyl transferase superfamily protein [Flavobacterium tructae]|uniref:4'-phosphopantetheinyl transferase family protein n=1 Tax=Flavobacterium tructae TaxID=1114873 RepID=UPI0035A9A3AD
MIHILYSYLSEEDHEFILQKVTGSFSQDYRRKISNYKRWQDTQLSVLGRVLLVRGLKNLNKTFYDENMRYTEFKKPYLLDESLQFNISHSGNIVVCVISDREVGIDIEILKEMDIEDFKSQMTATEWRKMLLSTDLKTSFFSYWTQKESVMKALGMGLFLPLSSFEITSDATKIGSDFYCLKEIKLDKNYMCHLAVKNETNIRLDSIEMINVVTAVEQLF